MLDAVTVPVVNQAACIALFTLAFPGKGRIEVMKSALVAPALGQSNQRHQQTVEASNFFMFVEGSEY